MVKFSGNLDKYKAMIEQLGGPGEWSTNGNAHVFRTVSGAIVNWWPKTGTINVQGKDTVKNAMRAAIQQRLNGKTEGSNPSTLATAQTKAKAEPHWQTYKAIIMIQKVE